MEFEDIIIPIITAVAGGFVGPFIKDRYQEWYQKRAQLEQYNLQFGQTVAIWGMGKYIQSDQHSDDGRLISKADQIASWETFEVVDPDEPHSPIPNRPVRYGRRIAFKSKYNNQFVGVNFEVSIKPLAAYISHVDTWETFLLLPLPKHMRVRWDKPVKYGDEFALQATNQKYVQCNLNHNRELVANGERIDRWETFVFYQPPTGE